MCEKGKYKAATNVSLFNSPELTKRLLERKSECRRKQQVRADRQIEMPGFKHTARRNYGVEIGEVERERKESYARHIHQLRVEVGPTERRTLLPQQLSVNGLAGKGNYQAQVCTSGT